MRELKESIRIKEIEARWSDSIENLLRKWHWENNLMHKEIGKKLNVPRPTITRWFKQLRIPSQSCTRFTNNNLRHPPKKPRPPKKPHFRLPVNENVFKNWSPEMAYVLGFFTADGCMFINPQGSHYIGFSSIDHELISKVRKILDSKHKIGIKKDKDRKGKIQYTLQIGGKGIFQDLLNLGLTPKKTKRERLPDIPKEYFAHFIRGYFDGDGCISFGFYQKKDRKKLTSILITRFTSSNRNFLKNLLKFLKKYTKIKGGCIYRKQEGSYDLSFSVRDSLKLYEFMYKDVKENQFLKRKYNKFQEALKYWGN